MKDLTKIIKSIPIGINNELNYRYIHNVRVVRAKLKVIHNGKEMEVDGVLDLDTNVVTLDDPLPDDNYEIVGSDTLPPVPPQPRWSY